MSRLKPNTVESFNFWGANFCGLWFFWLICGDVLSLMGWFSVSVGKLDPILNWFLLNK